MLVLILQLLGCEPIKPSDDSDSVPETGDSVPDSDDSGDTDSLYSTYYEDADGDGYGNPEVSKRATDMPSGYVDNALDCDDTDSAVNIDADEICGSGIDENCDQEAPECRSEGGELNGTHPVFYGTRGRELGSAISGAGDPNGDGFADAIFATSATDYVLMIPGQLDAESMEDADATYWRGSSGNLTGYSVSSVGDVDGDGYDDVVIGSPADDTEDDYAGSATLVLGPPDTGFIDLEDVAATRFLGSSAYYLFGTDVSPFGDIDDDGFSDFLIGESGYGDSGSGDAYHEGAVWGFSATQMSASALDDDEADYAFLGSDQDALGLTAATAHDADGQTLVALGAPYSRDGGISAGRAAVFANPDPGTRVADDADTLLTYNQLGAEFGGQVVLDDMNNDGYVDLWVGAAGDSTEASGAGAAYLYFGPLASLSDDVSSADAVVYGVEADEAVGTSVMTALSDAGSATDLWVGVPGYNDDQGGVALWYGGVLGTYYSNSADAIFAGQATGDRAGSVIANVGDVNQDGVDDAAVAAPYNDTEGEDGGALYLLTGWGF